jgi:predicted phosphohydrolase
MNSEITWLHLSDFHFGQETGKTREFILQNFSDEFIYNVKTGIKRLPDLLLITGDISFSGKDEEFNKFSDFYYKLLKDINWNPITLVVPGNHDLDRSKIYSMQDKALYGNFHNYTSSYEADSEWKKDLNNELFNDANSSILNKLFTNFLSFQKKIHPKEDDQRIEIIHYSHIPGDYYCKINIPNKLSLGIVGLNSAWLQCTNKDYENKLCIPKEQFIFALPNNDLNLLNKNEYNILLLHHPPSWFSNKYVEEFYSNIFSPSHFCLCLYGHMHKSRSEIKMICGGSPIFEIQADSICGIEKYGSNKVKRSFGFSIGLISERGEIRIWPYKYNSQSHSNKFLWNQAYGEFSDKGALLRNANIACNYNFKLHNDIQDIFTQNADQCRSVTILGIDNIILNNEIKLAMKLVADSCEEIKVIFPKKDNLKKLCSLLSLDYNLIQNKWEESIKGIRDILISRFAEKRWECLEYNGLLPFEAFIFDNERIYVRYLQEGYNNNKYMVLNIGYPCYNYLTQSILKSVTKCTPLMEYNMYGHVENNKYIFGGLIPESEWRKFRRNSNKNETYLVSICIPFVRYQALGKTKVLLHLRSENNSGDDFGKYSLLSGKLNDRDFFTNGILPREFLDTKIKYGRYTLKGTERQKRLMIENISKGFSKILKLNFGEVINDDILKVAAKNAVVRICGTELGLGLPSNEFIEIKDFTSIVDKRSVNLFVFFYTIDIDPNQLDLAKKNRPFWEFIELSVSEFKDHKSDFNDFLKINYDRIIEILLEKNVNQK